MKKPNNYETTQANREFTPLKLGGHVCKIMEVKEMVSRTGLSMIKISLDIAEGDQANYYADMYRANTNQDKKWGCDMYYVVDESVDYGTKNLKTFVTCVENSNNGFKVSWGENWGAQFKGKLVGGIFGREEYLNNKQEKKMATKCMQLRSVSSIRAGVEVPADKLLSTTNVNPSNAKPMQDGFMDIDPNMPEEFPFM